MRGRRVEHRQDGGDVRRGTSPVRDPDGQGQGLPETHGRGGARRRVHHEVVGLAHDASRDAGLIVRLVRLNDEVVRIHANAHEVGTGRSPDPGHGHGCVPLPGERREYLVAVDLRSRRHAVEEPRDRRAGRVRAEIADRRGDPDRGPIEDRRPGRQDEVLRGDGEIGPRSRDDLVGAAGLVVRLVALRDGVVGVSEDADRVQSRRPGGPRYGRGPRTARIDAEDGSVSPNLHRHRGRAIVEADDDVGGVRVPGVADRRLDRHGCSNDDGIRGGEREVPTRDREVREVEVDLEEERVNPLGPRLEGQGGRGEFR